MAAPDAWDRPPRLGLRGKVTALELLSELADQERMTLEQRLAAIRAVARRAAACGPAQRRRGRPAGGLGRRPARRVPGGRVALVERRIPLPPDLAARLANGVATAYLDTETTGLSTGAGTVVILAAVGHLDDGAIVVRQALLPDYPDEPALLRTVMGWVSGLDRMVTYNGRGFDIPLLAARMTIHGLGRDLVRLPARHDDLLPVARRLWRRILGGARLADIERGVLGVRRRGDCPSSEVPQRWFAYPAGASPDLLAAVIDHNAQDVASLALLDGELERLRKGGWRDGRSWIIEGWPWSCCATAPRTTRWRCWRGCWPEASRPRPLPGTSRSAFDAWRHACSSRAATRRGPSRCGATWRGAGRWRRRWPGSRLPASANARRPTCAGRWRRRAPRPASWTLRSPSDGAEASTASAGPGCWSSAAGDG